jgi:hypothetical protein
MSIRVACAGVAAGEVAGAVVDGLGTVVDGPGVAV